MNSNQKSNETIYIYIFIEIYNPCHINTNVQYETADNTTVVIFLHFLSKTSTNIYNVTTTSTFLRYFSFTYFTQLIQPMRSIFLFYVTDKGDHFFHRLEWWRRTTTTVNDKVLCHLQTTTFTYRSQFQVGDGLQIFHVGNANNTA